MEVGEFEFWSVVA